MRMVAVTAASHVVVCFMAVIALTGPAFAESGVNNADVHAEKECKAEESCECLDPNYDKYLGKQRKRYMELVSEFTAESTNGLARANEIAKMGIIKQRLMRFSCIFECQKKIAVKYIPLFNSVRTETEAVAVPEELLKPKGALLSAIDRQINGLTKLKELEFDEFVDVSLNSEGKGRKNDDSVHDCIPAAVSILPDLEFPSREKSVCGIRINAVGGSHADVSWIDIGTVFNSVSRKMRGIQLAGICNIGSNATEGIQFAGLANGCKSLVGLQGSAMFNVAGEVDGAQISGLINFNFKVRGCQISCSSNYSIIGKGCQLGWSNIAEKMDGTQFGVCLNACNALEGLQLAAFNWTDRCRGVQIGVVNQCEDAKGLQMGVVNYANAMSGCQIGVFNVIKTSSIPFLPIFNMNF